MKTVELKVARIGNSRGVRLPAATLARYDIGEVVIMEERTDGILLRRPGPGSAKLSWEDSAREMAAAAESWADWDVTLSDGLEQAPWDAARARRVAEKKAEYRPRERKKK